MPYEAIDHWSRLHERDDLSSVGQSGLSPAIDSWPIERAGAEPWRWGSPSPDVRAIITQTADPAWLDLDPAWFPGLRVVYDGRNSLAPLVERLGAGVAYRGVGVPGDRRAPVAVD